MKRKQIDGEGKLFEVSTTRPGPPPPEPKSLLQATHKLHSLRPDFKVLATKDPDLKPWIKGKRDLDFKNPAAVMQLTKTLLKLDFDLRLELPDDRLCPPVTNRLGYIQLLEQVLDSTNPLGAAPDAAVTRERKLVGVDIGTGASCIYPLLGCAQRPWSFLATDIDEKSLSHARKNIDLNNLQDRIKLLPRQPTDSLIPTDDASAPQHVDFVMTNPPFYTSQAQLEESAAKKKLDPFTACTGAPVEMITEGGEVGFVTRIIQESLLLKTRVQWYSSMLGFLSSVTALVERLRSHGVGNYVVREVNHTGKTRRWVLMWSFGALRPLRPCDPAASREGLAGALQPPKTSVTIHQFHRVKGEHDADAVTDFVDGLFARVGVLDLEEWTVEARTEGSPTWRSARGRCRSKVWGRAWRRMKKRKLAEDAKASLTTEGQDGEPFGFRLTVTDPAVMTCIIECHWVEGTDVVMFESFGGFLNGVVQQLQPEEK